MGGCRSSSCGCGSSCSCRGCRGSGRRRRLLLRRRLGRRLGTRLSRRLFRRRLLLLSRRLGRRGGCLSYFSGRCRAWLLEGRRGGGCALDLPSWPLSRAVRLDKLCNPAPKAVIRANSAPSTNTNCNNPTTNLTTTTCFSSEAHSTQVQYRTRS
jgi:hypothetical protein